MSNESQADVYASFGVQSMVLSGDNIEDHRQAMLATDVDVRDGDDRIELVGESNNVTVIDRVNDPLNTEERDVFTFDTENGTVTREGHEEGHEQLEVGDEAGDQEGDQEGFGEQLGDVPAALEEANNQIIQYADGLAQMKAQAIENGLTPEMAAQIEAEYERDSKLSEASLKALEEAGFKPAFVQSFLQGQESLATNYVNQIKAYAGGEETFNKLVAHLQANSPETIEVLEDAINRQDLKAVKATINLAKASHSAKFGKSPARTVTAKAPASAAKPSQQVQVEGFKSTDEMVKAMSDRRYATDPKYREEVRRKVERM